MWCICDVYVCVRVYMCIYTCVFLRVLSMSRVHFGTYVLKSKNRVTNARGAVCLGALRFSSKTSRSHDPSKARVLALRVLHRLEACDGNLDLALDQDIQEANIISHTHTHSFSLFCHLFSYTHGSKI